MLFRSLINEIAAEFGAQCCVCAVDAKRRTDGVGWEVFLHGGRTPTGIDAIAWIIDAVRSPRGKGKDTGALHDVHPQRILAQVLNALQARNGFDPADVDDVVMGCGAGSGDHSMDIARMAALDAGWSIEAPGVTLNRFCGSGQQAVNFGAMGILAGFQDLVVSGGVESMSRPSPMHVDGFTANNNHLRDQYEIGRAHV